MNKDLFEVLKRTPIEDEVYTYLETWLKVFDWNHEVFCFTLACISTWSNMCQCKEACAVALIRKDICSSCFAQC